MRTDLWKGRRVLVTGHTGFKGSWLSLWLQRMEAELVGFALAPPTTPSLFELANVADGMTSIIGDVRNFEALREVIERHDPEVIVHMAAQSVVRVSYEDPLDTYSTNVMGTANLLEAMRQVPGRRSVVNVTTDKCYENNEWIWGYREIDRLGGFDPYSNSKACSELVTASFRDSFFPPDQTDAHGVAIASARAGNVIGGGDWTPHQLIPDVVQAFAETRAVRIRSPRAVRPWQFVLEPLRGYLCLAQALLDEGARHAGGWNFGPEARDERPVSWVVNRLAETWGEGAKWELDVGEQPHEAGLMRLDVSKAAAKLDWHPALPLPDALAWVVEWYKAHRDGVSPRDATLAQIIRYEQRIAAGSDADLGQGVHS